MLVFWFLELGEVVPGTREFHEPGIRKKKHPSQSQASEPGIRVSQALEKKNRGTIVVTAGIYSGA